MATRTIIPGTKSGGTDSLSVSDFNSLPGGCIAYVSKTGNQAGITTTTDISGLSIAYTFPGGRMYNVHAHLPQVQIGGGNGHVQLYFRDATIGTVAVMAIQYIPDAQFGAFNCQYRYVPSAGAATVKLSISAVGSGVAVDVNCSTEPSNPGEARFWIEDIGPSF